MKLSGFLIVILLSFNVLAGEIIEQVFVSGGFTYNVTVLDTLRYPFVTVKEDHLLLITHNSDYWDKQHITWPATATLIRFFREKNRPLLYLADIQDRALFNTRNFLPAPVLTDEIYPFQGDSHRIIMQGQNIVIAGGNFTICACQTTRSAIALSQTRSSLKVYLALDAIYEGIAEMQVTLKEIVDKLKEEEFLSYLKTNYFNEDGLPCHESLLSTNRTFKYKIYLYNRLIGEVGNGHTDVELLFDSSSAIVNKL